MECGCTAVVTVDLDVPRREGDGVQGRVVHCPMHAAADEMLAALKDAVGAFEYQVTLCHARDAAFLDKDIWARPMDYQEVVANMYAATAGPLTKARKAIGAAS